MEHLVANQNNNNYLSPHIEVAEDKQLSPWLRNFINIYQQLNTENIELLEQVYAENIQFIDPIHEVNGFQNLSDYFESLYTNLVSCQFAITEVIEGDNCAAIYWTMEFCHPKLNSGNAVSLVGSSQLKAVAGKVFYHRDFVDLGAMLYEHIPVVGRIIKAVKKRASK